MQQLLNYNCVSGEAQWLIGLFHVVFPSPIILAEQS
jgi:hypothetical protein